MTDAATVFANMNTAIQNMDASRDDLKAKVAAVVALHPTHAPYTALQASFDAHSTNIDAMHSASFDAGNAYDDQQGSNFMLNYGGRSKNPIS